MPDKNTMGITLQGNTTSLTYVYENKESFVSGIKTLDEFLEFN